MKRLVVWFIVTTTATLSMAGMVRGTVRDKASGAPIPGAEVRLEPAGPAMPTDQAGRFLFEAVPAGTYTLTVFRDGYATWTRSVQVTGETISIVVRLSALVVQEQITVTATRAQERKTPVVFADMPAAAIREQHTTEDIPMLLSGLPNTYAYSDDGSGMGYSYLKVRGFDQSRIGVMINGIPLNDPEDHQVYWVDMPDFAESLDSIQLQRGVGTSLYGVDTFGGSVNLLTKTGTGEGFQFYGVGGSFNTWKTGVTGEMPLPDDRWHLSFRASRLVSDGYRGNSGVRQWSAYLALSRRGDRSETRLVTYTGNEIAHAAWEASPESVLKEHHRDNPITYPNTIDNFSQPHLELHHFVQLSDASYLKLTGFYIHGRGYYEQYKSGRNLWEYGLWPDPDTAPEADMIRQKWVKKNQYGVVGEWGWHHERGDLTAGAYVSSYNSHHWGEVDQLVDLELPGFHPGFVYHRYYSDKKYATLYLNELFQPTDAVTVMANLHYQHISYGLDQQPAGNFTGENRHVLRVVYNFWNPRFGVNVNLTDTVNLYVNISASHREPADSELFDTWMGPDDLGVPPLFATRVPVGRNGVLDHYLWFDPEVKAEKLLDYEAGVVRTTGRMTLRANLFWMNFSNEIVPYGQVNDDGFPIRGNADRTVHRGIELSGQFRLTDQWDIDANFSWNDNYFDRFIFHDYDWNTGETMDIDLSGNAIAGFPDTIGNLTVRYRTGAVTAAVRWQVFGKQFLDNTENSDRTIPAYSMVHAWCSWNLGQRLGARQVELTARINNLFNRLTYTAGYYDAWAGENYYWPSAGFHFTAGVRLTY